MENMDKELINLIFTEEIQGVLTSFYMNTLSSQKYKVLNGLKSSDFDIVLSTYNAENKEIFHSINICNSKFDPNTQLSKISPNKDDIDKITKEFNDKKADFEKLFKVQGINLFPKIRRNLRFNICLLNYKIVKEGKVMDYKMEHENDNPDKKDILCVISLKLNKKRHKLGKYTQMLEQFNEFKEFWDSHRIAYFIFVLNEEEDVLTEYKLFPEAVRTTNEKYDKVRLIFYIKPKGEDEKEFFNIFENCDYGKNYYFHLNANHEVYRVDDMLCSGDIIENNIKRKKKLKEINEKNKDKTKEQLDKERDEAFITYYTFLKNIKNYRYTLFTSFEFDVCLKMDKNFDLYVSYIDFSNMIGEYRTKEYNLIKACSEVLNPDNCELEEFKTTDVNINFDNMICFRCQKEITTPDLYYCYKCNTKYCRQCVRNNYLQSTGKAKFIDNKHNLLYFKTRDVNQFKNLDNHKLGKDLFAQCDNNSKLGDHSATCNGCKGPFENSPRYICLHCRPGKAHNDGYFDYCDKCILEMRDGTPQGKVIEQKEKDRVYSDETRLLYDEKETYTHSHDNHVYLMVALEYKKGQNAYYEF